MEEAAAEVTKVKAIIEVTLDIYAFLMVLINICPMLNCYLDHIYVGQSLIRREGHLIVVDDGTQAGEESGRQSASRNDRILAVAPNYVVD